MKKMTKRIISIILTLCLTFLATVPVLAADEDEEYLSDLRLIYADDYDEAAEILADSELEGYEIFDANLNEGTGKGGVYLAYLTTTDIEDAITDIAIMQMDGGYNEGNYREMVAQSLAEYEAMGRNYLTAIEHFNKGIDAGHYLSEIAHRQLNFYNVVTEGIDEIPDFEGERIGDIFYNGIDVNDLATIFMEGNVYALSNIRSLIAMGVSYNEDGKTYLEHVAIEAEKYAADKTIYNNEDYTNLANMIALSIVEIHGILKEYEAHKDDLNYNDDDFTDLEFQYMESLLIAEMLQDVNYLDGKTLYNFVLEYSYNQDNLSDLYPLVAALNEGQIAMTKVAHYYDVIRYSMTLETNEEIETELAEAEAEYGDYPFNVYEGVDRTIYDGTFALTSAAYRADAFTEEGLSGALYGGELSKLNTTLTYVGYAGASIVSAGLLVHGFTKIKAAWKVRSLRADAFKFAEAGYYESVGNLEEVTSDYAIEYFNNEFTSAGFKAPSNFDSMTFEQQFDVLNKFYGSHSKQLVKSGFRDFRKEVENEMLQHKGFAKAIREQAGIDENWHKTVPTGVKVAYGMYVVGGLMMLASAITMGIQIYNYYHPEYSDIPTAMVDLIDTKDGDRYIKYDVVYEAEYNEDGGYSAADLNAFSASRWNAMYYTKSYEAGKPLLAGEFVISTNNNVPAEKHMPVHRFGEVVSYNLNKYNFNDDHSIYLSIKQSDNQKKAVADVPEIVGSLFGKGFIAIAGGIGLVAGIGGTIASHEIIKKAKSNKEDPDIKEEKSTVA